MIRENYTPTPEDNAEREALAQTLDIMKRQGVTGITQSSDYQRALGYEFLQTNYPEVELKYPKILDWSQFKVVAFDLDGVLRSSAASVYGAEALTLNQYQQLDSDHADQIPKNANEVENSYMQPWREYYARFGITDHATQDKMYRSWESKRQELEQVYPEDTFFDIEALKSLLGRLKSLQKTIVLVTLSDQQSAEAFLKKANLTDYFDQTIFKHTSKTDALKKLVAQEGGEDCTVVYIGDSPSDIVDARAAGVSSVAMARSPQALERLTYYSPNYIVESFENIDGVSRNYPPIDKD